MTSCLYRQSNATSTSLLQIKAKDLHSNYLGKKKVIFWMKLLLINLIHRKYFRAKHKLYYQAVSLSPLKISFFFFKVRWVFTKLPGLALNLVRLASAS